MKICQHGQRDPASCHGCIARAWKRFHQMTTSARERLPEGTVPAMLVCVNLETGEFDLIGPDWLVAPPRQAAFLRRILRELRSAEIRRVPLE